MQENGTAVGAGSGSLAIAEKVNLTPLLVSPVDTGGAMATPLLKIVFALFEDWIDGRKIKKIENQRRSEHHKADQCRLHSNPFD